MLLVGCSATGWIPVAQQPEVGLLLIAVVVPLELVATVFAFPARDTLGATTLGLFTTSWLALGWSDRVSAPGATSKALGIEDVRRQELLPLFRRRGAQRAFEGYGAQLERLETEPGVRQQL